MTPNSKTRTRTRVADTLHWSSPGLSASLVLHAVIFTALVVPALMRGGTDVPGAPRQPDVYHEFAEEGPTTEDPSPELEEPRAEALSAAPLPLPPSSTIDAAVIEWSIDETEPIQRPDLDDIRDLPRRRLARRSRPSPIPEHVELPVATPEPPWRLPPPAPPTPQFVGAALRRGLCPQPAYPERAARRRLEGRVTLLVEVDARGVPTSVAVDVSSGHEMLDEAALEAVRRWQFTAATLDGRPTTDRIRIPIRFVADR